jgi:Bacterial TSP3 repeat
MRSGHCFRLVATVAVFVAAQSMYADTTITFARAEVNEMAMLWETDCVSVSSLANAQYPSIAGTWDFIFPHTAISSDGDIHVDMAIDASGTGSTGNNTGESPLICEVINATQTQLTHLDGLTGARATFRGIFRFYTEHAGERHFELHPVTQLQTWNGSAFVDDSDYHANIVADPNGTTHANSTLIGLLDGSETMSATVASDNTNVTFTFPSPSVNYVQYDGVAVSGLQSDALSQYFLFQPNLVPNATVRCRLVANTDAATAASGLAANQNVTVNALTRTDMSAVASTIASMSAGQQKTFPRPVELIVLDLPSIGPPPTPTPSASPFVNSTSIAIKSGHSGETAADPYPSAINVSGLAGTISKVTVSVNGLNTSGQAAAEDIDILMTGPSGENTMLMSDAGGLNSLSNVNLTFDDAAASELSTSQITSGTYQPTNFNPRGDKDAFPSPAPGKPFGSTLSDFNGASPNGTWNLFVLDEYTSGTGSIANGWSISIVTVPAPPFVTTTQATNLTSTTATLNGSVNALGLDSTFDFQFGTGTDYMFAQSTQSAGSGTAAVPVSVGLVGLSPATTYHYRLSGANTAGVTDGVDMTFTTLAFADSDGDGMPDDYETAHGLSPNDPSDAATDLDGDGMTNLQEYLAGTDPRSPVSLLRISSIQTSGGDIVVTFPSVLGKLYRVEETDDFGASWSVLTDNLPGNGSAMNVVDTEAADNFPRRFYRVILLQ